MIIIRIFGVKNKDFGKYLPNYKKDFIITNGDNYTHVIICNPECIQPILSVPKENVVAVTGEAPKFLCTDWNLKIDKSSFLRYCQRTIGKFLVGGVKNTNIPNAPPFLGYYCSWTSGSIPKTIYQKTKKMSIIISSKSFFSVNMNKIEGYIYRKKLVNYLLKSNFPIDIYGNGCQYLRKDKLNRIKGTFNNLEPYEAYQFTIVIENMRYPHYISEKFERAIQFRCTPIYWGATHVEKYYPNNCIQLNGNIKRDLLLIKDILIHPNKYLKDMDKAQENYYVNNNLIKKCVRIWKNSK